jgi:predicted anti-sigma-YlaC factor YlaD
VTCRDVHAFLSDWLTGDLPRGVREVFARHLGGCASCRAYLDSYEKTIALARAAEHEELPPSPHALEEAILALLGGGSSRAS